MIHRDGDIAFPSASGDYYQCSTCGYISHENDHCYGCCLVENCEKCKRIKTVILAMDGCGDC